MRAHIVKVIDGIRYNTETATVIASNEYWDGSNYERHGCNTHLYKSPKGRYFAGYSTCWQGERNTLEPLSVEDARDMYENLKEHECEYEEAFPGSKVEEA